MRADTPAVTTVPLRVGGNLPREQTALHALTQMCAMSSVVSRSARQGTVALPSFRRSLQEQTTHMSILVWPQDASQLCAAGEVTATPLASN